MKKSIVFFFALLFPQVSFPMGMGMMGGASSRHFYYMLSFFALMAPPIFGVMEPLGSGDFGARTG